MSTNDPDMQHASDKSPMSVIISIVNKEKAEIIEGLLSIYAMVSTSIIEPDMIRTAPLNQTERSGLDTIRQIIQSLQD